MSRRRSVPVQDDEGKVDMSPMIDLVFLLLIFFIVNANIITVQIDESVSVPVADKAVSVETADGRIVINIYEDGTIKAANGTVLTEDADIENYVKMEAERIKSLELNVPPSVHLRGDKASVFKHTKKVVLNAAKAGVEDVRFAALLNN